MTVRAWGRPPYSTLSCSFLRSLFLSFLFSVYYFSYLCPVSLSSACFSFTHPHPQTTPFLLSLSLSSSVKSIIIATMATTSTQKQPSKRSSDEEREEFPLKCQSPVPNPAIYPNEMYLCRRDEYHEMINHHKAVFYSRTRYRAAEVTVGDAFESVFVRVRTWATMWGKGESLSHLSDSDKQAIIASLEEYCVQEDWDSILLNLPPAARANFGLILVETMLNQFICTKFTDSPFWFMDGKINATDSETQSDFHKRFQYVYEKLIQGQFMHTTLSFALYYHVLLFCSCFFVPSILVSYFNLLTDRQPDLLTLTKLQSFPRGCSMVEIHHCRKAQRRTLRDEQHPAHPRRPHHGQTSHGAREDLYR